MRLDVCILREKIWLCNLNVKDMEKLKGTYYKEEGFWVDVLRGWCLINFRPVNELEGRKMIWMNSLIRVNDLPVLVEKSYRKGLLYVDQLYVNNQLISVRKAHEEFGLSMLEFHGLVTAIPNLWRKSYGSYLEGALLHERIRESKSISKYAYTELNKSPDLLQVKKQKWSGDRNSIP